MKLTTHVPQILGGFDTTDKWQAHVNRIFYGMKGPDIHGHFQTFVSRDYKLPHAMAEDFYKQAVSSETLPALIYIHEWGVGNGNLAACFLNHVKELDQKDEVYRRTRYILCDYSSEILRGIRMNPEILCHEGIFRAVKLDLEGPSPFKEGEVFRIISNELWDDLRTKVLIKSKGKILEEHLRPNLKAERVNEIADFEELVRDFNRGDIEKLRGYPRFLEDIIWERDYYPINWNQIKYAKAIRNLFKEIKDDIAIPINVGAFRVIEKAYKMLMEGGIYSVFDYGISDIDKLNDPDTSHCNLYGGQYTFMVNFPLMEEVARFVGFREVTKEAQYTYVERQLGEQVVSLIEIVETHTHFESLTMEERDLLVLKTLHVLNSKYRSPYARDLGWAQPETDSVEKKRITRDLATSLDPYGVPDTVAYISYDIITSVMNELEELGYARERIPDLFENREKKTDYFHLLLKK